MLFRSYIDTCGKYYTYEYTQSLNHIQYPSSTTSQPQPVVIKEVPVQQSTPMDSYSKLTNVLVNKGLDLISKVDTNTINGLVSSVLTNMQGTTPIPTSYNAIQTTHPFTDYTTPPRSNMETTTPPYDQSKTNEPGYTTRPINENSTNETTAPP